MTTATASTSSVRASFTMKLAAVGLALAAVVIFLGNYHVRKGENGGAGAAAFSAVVCAVVGAALFGVIVPRVRNRDRAPLVLSVLTVLSLPVFWLGVTAILGAATLATVDPQTPTRPRAAVARWLAIGATAVSVIVSVAGSHL